MKKPNVLLAGATGYLGSYILKELLTNEYPTRIIVRYKNKIPESTPAPEIIEAEVTHPDTLSNAFSGIDVVISTIGITRQKDGLTYMDVDYKANVNLVNKALEHGVKKFIYVSVLNGTKIRNLKIGEAKEKFVDYLTASGLDFCIIRPNGFFSDMRDFLKMAKRGKVYLFGDGKLKLNPIHGEDLAKVCVSSIHLPDREINIGGPDLLSQNEIAELALAAYSKPVKIIHLPDWIRKLTLWTARTFTGSSTYGPIEFFLTTMVMDMEAPCFGTHKLEDFFREEARKQS